MNRRLIMIVVPSLILVSLVLAACAPTAPEPGQPEPTQPESPATDTPAAQPTATPAEAEQPPVTPAPILGGELVYVLPSDIASFDPHTTRETVSGMVNSQIFDYLTVLNSDGSVGPGLAQSWETSEDDRTWTFNLVSDVTFHDGEPFNAEAVKVNFDRILNPDNALPAVQLLRGVVEVRAVDETTLEIVTEEPFGPLPFHLTHYSLGIVSPSALENMSTEELGQNPIGTGPFKFVRYTPNDRIILEANPDYWGEGPYVSTVVFRPAPEIATRSLLLETGEADIVAHVSPQDVEALGNVNGVRVDVIPFTRVIFIHMNGSKEPFSDVEVRRALSWAIDRQTIVDVILRGYASVANGPMGDGVYGYTETSGYGYDPEMARQLLADAGYPNGFSTTLWVPAGRYQGAEEAAQALQAQLAEVGVDVQLEIIEFSTLLDQVRKPPEESTYDMVLLGFAPATNDADWQMYSQFHSSSFAPLSNNRSYYSNTQVDELLETGRFSIDPDTRLAAYAEALQIINDEAPELYLYQGTQIYGVNERVSDLVYLPIDIQDLETVKIDQ